MRLYSLDSASTFKIGQISSWLLLNLVEDILDMAKFTAKTFQLTIEQFKLETVLSEIEYIFGFQCAEKKLGFKIDWEPSIANIVYNSDVKRLKRVLINLVSNSLKFTETGDIVVKVRKCLVDRQTFIKFNFIDTGVGISKHDIPKLFKYASFTSYFPCN